VGSTAIDTRSATVDAIDVKGRFLGGLIVPGFAMMQRTLQLDTAGLKVLTGEVVDFPTNTSDALMTGGSSAIAGDIERQHRKLRRHTGLPPLLYTTGGAAAKLAPITDLQVETADSMIFHGLLQIQSHPLAL